MIIVDILRPSVATDPPSDTTPPAVTINQAAGQSDPTSASPINFTAVFSESVSGFTAADVTITGTAGGTKTVTITGGPSTYNVAVSGMTTAGTVIASIAAGAAQDAAGNPNTASTSTDNSVTFTAYDPQIQWSAGMETGDLSEWQDQSISDSAISTAVTAASAGIPPKAGSWVMKQAVTGSVGGTRMTPYTINGLSQAGTTFYASWWMYFPQQITYSPGNQYMIWGINSQAADLSYNPIWALYVERVSFSLTLGWSPNNTAPSNGPHNGESGSRAYYDSTPIPIAQWSFFEIMVTPSAGFTGALKIWMDRALLFDLSLIKTRFPGTGGADGGWMYTNHNAYGSGLTPTPAFHFVDAATYSLGRMP